MYNLIAAPSSIHHLLCLKDKLGASRGRSDVSRSLGSTCSLSWQLAAGDRLTISVDSEERGVRKRQVMLLRKFQKGTLWGSPVRILALFSSICQSQKFWRPRLLMPCVSVCRPLNVGFDAVGLVRGRLLRDLGAPAAAQLEAEGRRRLLERGLSLALPFKGQSHMRLKRTSPDCLD